MRASRRAPAGFTFDGAGVVVEGHVDGLAQLCASARARTSERAFDLVAVRIEQQVEELAARLGALLHRLAETVEAPPPR